MKVAVTGGTGFIGSHSVAALVQAGHAVKLLVRAPERIAPALEPLGVGPVEHVVGDVTDSAAVERLLEGCDAVLHGASIYSLDPRRAKEIRATNVTGTELVLGAAHQRGLDPIIHVSSVVALMGERRATLSPDTVPLSPPGAYARSKADSERVARRLQETGAPVVSVYPGQVFGPHDPHWGEGQTLITMALKGNFRFAPPGTIPVTDVREVAKLHVALMDPGKGPRRYLAPVVTLTVRELLDALGAATGRNLKMTTIPAGLVTLPIKGLDLLQRIVPARFPLNSEALWILTREHTTDDSATCRDFGLEPRPVEETLRDTVEWMVGTGRLSPKLAGR